MINRYHIVFRLQLKITILCIVLLSCITGIMAEPESDRPTLEYKIKATFLFNFLKYIEWPKRAFDQSQDQFVIGIIGDNRFGSATDYFKGKNIRGRLLDIQTISELTEVSNCHILFVSSSEKNNIKRILSLVQNRTILTIGESDSFIDHGGIIEFVIDQGKVRFKVNLNVARNEGFVVSSKLLRIAKEVKEK